MDIISIMRLFTIPACPTFTHNYEKYLLHVVLDMYSICRIKHYTVCPRISDPFCIVIYFMRHVVCLTLRSTEWLILWFLQ